MLRAGEHGKRHGGLHEQLEDRLTRYAFRRLLLLRGPWFLRYCLTIESQGKELIPRQVHIHPAVLRLGARG